MELTKKGAKTGPTTSNVKRRVFHRGITWRRTAPLPAHPASGLILCELGPRYERKAIKRVQFLPRESTSPPLHPPQRVKPRTKMRSKFASGWLTVFQTSWTGGYCHP